MAQVTNDWWVAKAKLIQTQVDAKEPQHQYAGFRELRAVLGSGRRPLPKLTDPAGELLCSVQERAVPWRRYFNYLLNVPSAIGFDYILPAADSLGDTPTFVEFCASVHRFKTGKACGPDGLPVEIMQAMERINLRVMYERLVRVWCQVAPMPPEWLDGYLCLSLKKGDLSSCSNWRGITLLSGPGKVFARIIAARLYDYSETHHLLPEWQCGFRAGHSAIDMVFTLRMILETAKRKQRCLIQEGCLKLSLLCVATMWKIDVCHFAFSNKFNLEGHMLRYIIHSMFCGRSLVAASGPDFFPLFFPFLLCLDSLAPGFKQGNQSDYKRRREVELKHGRVAMSLGCNNGEICTWSGSQLLMFQMFNLLEDEHFMFQK